VSGNREPVGFGAAAGMVTLGIVAYLAFSIGFLPVCIGLMGSDGGAVGLYLIGTTAAAFAGGGAVWRKARGAQRYFGLGLMAGWGLVALLAGVCIAALSNAGL
jgi:hypothetical protein